jgi:hypothetical protein
MVSRNRNRHGSLPKKSFEKDKKKKKKKIIINEKPSAVHPRRLRSRIVIIIIASRRVRRVRAQRTKHKCDSDLFYLRGLEILISNIPVGAFNYLLTPI